MTAVLQQHGRYACCSSAPRRVHHGSCGCSLLAAIAAVLQKHGRYACFSLVSSRKVNLWLRIKAVALQNSSYSLRNDSFCSVACQPFSSQHESCCLAAKTASYSALAAFFYNLETVVQQHGSCSVMVKYMIA